MPQPTSRTDAQKAAAGFDFRALEASTVVAAIVVAPDGSIVTANARLRRFLGIGDSGTAARLVDHMVDEAQWESWRDAPPIGRAVEVELRGFDGTTRVFRGDLLVQGEGAGRRIVGVFVDGDD